MLCVAFCLYKTLHNLHYEQIGKEVRCIEDELPFEIPNSWQYVRLGSLLLKLTDGTHSTPKYKERGIPFVSVKDISTGCLDLTDTKYISIEEHEELYKRCDPQKGDILLSKVGTTGIPVLIDTDIAFSLFVSVALLKFNHYDINPFFLIYLLSSPLVQNQCKENTKGVGNKNWVMRDIASTLVVIPPYIEQLRIVDKIKELEPLIEKYKQAEEKLYILNSTIKEQLKKSILQYAIEGKLVPQDPNDEPASILLERIRKEKEKLIAEGKIKKNKNESIIYRRDNSYYEKQNSIEICINNELPFEIPDSWEWTNLGNIAFITKLAGFEYTKYISQNITNHGVPLFKGKNVLNGLLNENFEAFIPEYLSDSLERSQLTKKCLLTPYVGTIGNIAIFNGNYKAHLGSNVGKIEMYTNLVVEEYTLLFLRSQEGYNQLSKYKKSTAQESISIDALRNAWIPIPPISEQQKIVNGYNKIVNILS